MTTSVLIAEDQEIARLGLRLTLEQINGICVVGEAADGEAVIIEARRLQPRVILMDIDLPGMSGIEATRQIKRSHPNTGIIMLTSDTTDESIYAALSAGADGYCLKNTPAERLGTAIKSVTQGAAWLDPGIANKVLRAQREAQAASAKQTAVISDKSPTEERMLLDANQLEVLQLIEKGESMDQIALRLKVSSAAVESKVRAIIGSFLETLNLPKAPPPNASYTNLPALSAGSSPNASYASLPAMRPPGSPLTPISPGTILGDKYIIEEEIGKGGMSTVFRGKHLLMNRPVAIKMLHQRHVTKDLQVKRFLHEAQTAAALSHPNVVTIHDFGLSVEQQPYIVMDYLDGKALSELIAKKPLRAPRMLHIFIQICDALMVAHKKGIIHRDLKPSNIMLVNTDDGSDLVKLVDFGIAKYMQESDDLKLTKTGELFGTPFYMSPEQCRGLNMDSRSDIYSLGCVMFETLTGEPPFHGLSAYETMSQHVNEPISVERFNKPDLEIPDDLKTFVLRCLAKEPDLRPQSASDLRVILYRTLVSILSEPPKTL